MFVTLEGPDGAGKSTQARLLADALGPEAVLLREPGGTPAGERLRELLKDGSLELEPRTELLLFCAARAELVERVIRPTLAAGRDVVCDRFVDSTVAYQGSARGLGTELVATLNAIAVAGCMPDRTILLELDPAVAAERMGGRGEPGAAPDRFESEGADFQHRVGEAFAELARAEPERVRAVAASGVVADVHERILAAVRA